MRIAMVSEPASPLAAFGGPDAGGRHEYVACLTEEAARRGHHAPETGLRVWALTGPAPDPLMAGIDESPCGEAASAATVQELQLVAVHMVCAAFDAAPDRHGR
jgi:hypothetical protein